MTEEEGAALFGQQENTIFEAFEHMALRDRRLKISAAQWNEDNVSQLLKHRCAYLNDHAVVGSACSRPGAHAKALCEAAPKAIAFNY